MPRRGQECWLGLMHEVQLLRRAAVFGHSHALVTLSEGGARATESSSPASNPVHNPSVATSNVAMRAGRHYAQFTLVRGTVRCGVMQNNVARIHGEYCWGAVLSCEGAWGAGASTSSTRIESVPAPAYTPPTEDDLARTLALQDKVTLRVTQRWVRNLHHDVEDVDFFIKRTDPDHLSRLMELWVQRQGGARSDYIFTYNGQMLAEDIIHTAAQLQMLSGDIIEVITREDAAMTSTFEFQLP